MDLGDRMKDYEKVPRLNLVKKMPVIIRIDGKAFHTLTKKLKGYTPEFAELVYQTAQYLAENIQNCKLAYAQSDEISLLLTDFDNTMTHAWFDNNIQKITSISASMATMAFNNLRSESSDLFALNGVGSAMFDSRTFNLPKEEVVNYFIWRQQDATRNAIQMLGQSNFSHKQLHGISCDGIQEKLFQEKGINFNDCVVPQKRGICVVKKDVSKEAQQQGRYVIRRKWQIDRKIPVFTQDRDYIGRLLQKPLD